MKILIAILLTELYVVAAQSPPAYVKITPAFSQ